MRLGDAADNRTHARHDSGSVGAGGGAFYISRVQRVRASKEALYNQSGFLPQQPPAPWDQPNQYDERWP